MRELRVVAYEKLEGVVTMGIEVTDGTRTIDCTEKECPKTLADLCGAILDQQEKSLMLLRSIDGESYVTPDPLDAAGLLDNVACQLNQIYDNAITIGRHLSGIHGRIGSN